MCIRDRRRTVLQGIEQETELHPLLRRRDVQRLEDASLHVGAVDTHRAAADLPAIEHHVVGLGDAGTGVGLHQLIVAVLGCRERVVHGVPALGVLIELEHRKVHQDVYKRQDLAPMRQSHLRRAQNVAGRMQAELHTVDDQHLAMGQALQRDRTQARAQHAFADGRGQVGGMTAPGVVGMCVRDHRTRNRPPRVDVEVTWRAVQALRALHDQVLGHGSWSGGGINADAGSAPWREPGSCFAGPGWTAVPDHRHALAASALPPHGPDVYKRQS